MADGHDGEREPNVERVAPAPQPDDEKACPGSITPTVRDRPVRLEYVIPDSSLWERR